MLLKQLRKMQIFLQKINLSSIKIKKSKKNGKNILTLGKK
jgi:hypothetical protein